MRRNTLLALGLCFTLGLLMASELSAATYYVAPSGNDSNSGTKSKKPLRTIKQAASLARNGDQVYVSAGEYADNFNVSGKQSSGTLQFIVSTPNSVTISGQVNVVDSNGIVFSGFKFAGNADRFLTWQGSYDGSLSGCQFVRGRNALLVKSGSVTLDQCTLTDFVGDGIEIDGTAKLLINNSQISGCQGSAVKILKNAAVAVDGSDIKNNVGDGIRVAVDTGSVPVTGNCDCTGTSPQSMKKEAYDLLAGVNPQSATYRQAIADARSAINSSLSPSLWTDPWTATLSGGQTIYDRSKTALQLLNAVYTDDIDFFISGDNVIINQPFKLSAKVLGAEISNGSYYDVPVTASIKAGNNTYQPWGSFNSPTQGNVNDNSNPRNFSDPTVHPAGTSVSISGRSWLKNSNSNSGTSDSHWYSYLTVSSSSQSGNLIVLRDGDSVPNLAGYGGQAAASSFLAPYIQSGKLKLAKNQAVFLFELGTTNLSSSAADFQDLVVLISMQATSSAVTPTEAAIIMQAMNLLVEADKNLASCAISKAKCAGGNAGAISEAEAYFDNGLREAAAGRHEQASQNFKTAWEAAQKALSNSSGSGSVSSTSPKPPTGWSSFPQPIVTVSSSTLTRNNSGVAMFTVGSFSARISDFSNNKQWGTRLRGEVNLDNCTINTNGDTGVLLEDATAAKVIVNGLTLKNNVKYGLYAKKSGLEFDATKLRQWSISGSEVLIAGETSDISFSNLTVTGGTTAAVSMVDGNMKAASSTFSGSGYGISVTNSNFALYDCTLSGNKVGLHAQQNKSLSIQQSKLIDNTEWGVKLHGPGSFTDTTISGNGTGGLELTKMTGTDLSLTRTTVSDNTTYGLYCIDSTLTFNAAALGTATITGSKTLFAGFESSLTFDGLKISGGSQYGIANFGGKVGINNCTLSGNGIGLYSDYGCVVTKSTFTGNTTTGASVLGSASFSQCLIEKNPNGLQITNDKTGLVTLAGSQIKDNTVYGIWFDGCTTTFDASKQADWSVQNNGSNFGATGSTLTFNGFTISNGKTYGVVSEKGTLNLNNSTLTANGTGAFIAADSTLVASGTKFTSNTLYGVSIRGKATLQNCTLERNTHGLQFANMTAGDFTSSGTTAANNSQAGLHLDSCTLTLTGSGINGLTLSDNQYGIYSTNSTLVFDGFASKSNTYGAWLTTSNVTMKNSTFTGSTYGLWATGNNSLNVDSSTFSGNGSYGVYLVGAGSLHNCSITGNGSGLYLNGTNVTDATLTGTKISGNSLYGVYSYNGSLTLTDQSTKGWSIDGNGYNIAGYQADITLTGAKMTGAKNYGVMAQYGSLNVTQSTIASDSGGVWGLYTTGFTVDQSHISGSNAGTWGVVNVEGGLAMRNSVVSGAQYGVYSYDVAKPVTIYNSTIADAALYGVYAYNGDLTLMNTIVSGTGGTYGLYVGPSANVVHSYNLVSGFAVPFENTTADPTELSDPPRFTDAANGDYSLGKGSPAINAGTDMSASHTVDMMGNARPSHKVFEIGAYEYMQDAGSFRVLDWKERR